MKTRMATSAWLGFSFAALFLYPLADALDSGIYYLQLELEGKTAARRFTVVK